MEPRAPTSFPVISSGRRVRLSTAHLRALFGSALDAPTTLLALDDEGLVAALETVMVKGPSGELGPVRVVGPLAPTSVVDLLPDDFARVGLAAPTSRKVDGSPGVLLEGPFGSVALAEGALPLVRHLRLHPSDARDLGLRDGDTVDLRVSGDRARVFSAVPVTVVGADGPPRSVLVLDADDANTIELDARTRAVIVDDEASAG